MAARYKIMGIPSVKLFKGGEVVESLEGLRPKDAYIQAINNHK
jgi:thioredoxin-like negative regulator of GroEL